MLSPAMVQRIELWPVDKLIPYARNPRTHSDAQVAQIAASIAEFGFNSPVLVDSNAGIVAGHGRLLAARKLGLTEVPVIVLDHLSDTQKRAYLISDNRLSDLSGWDQDLLAAELAALNSEGFELALTGFSDADVEALLTDRPGRAAEDQAEGDEQLPEAPAHAITQPGDVWAIGPHRLLCGDCRDREAVLALFGATRANVVVTSPPYASQREYDPASGFQPIRQEEYVNWYRDVAANIEAVLAADGSYFLNIKEHAEDGQRVLYVKDLTLAHVRQWGWRFVDEFCWRKTDNGVPGGWGNRFKNAWEPIFHFCRQQQIKFRPKAVGHVSEDCFDYSPDNPKSTSGSGLLGTGPRGEAASGSGEWNNLFVSREGRHKGIARPSNVIEVRTETSQGSHSAPFPRALVEFFVEAYTDAGDVVFDPFGGSGTTLAAAAVLERAGYGTEISPAYCDVIVRRLQQLLPDTPAVLAGTDQTFDRVAAARGVDSEAAGRPRERDSRAIKHKNGIAPCYGPRRKRADKDGNQN